MDKKEGKQRPGILINSQYIKDLSLEIPHAPEIFNEINSGPNIEISVDIETKKLEGDGVFNVALKFGLSGKVKTKHLFILELEYASVVSLNVPEEHVEAVLMIEVPRLLFPFARSIITNNMVEAGLPPFMLNPIDFAAMYAARKSVKN